MSLNIKIKTPQGYLFITHHWVLEIKLFVKPEAPFHAYLAYFPLDPLALQSNVVLAQKVPEVFALQNYFRPLHKRTNIFEITTFSTNLQWIHNIHRKWLIVKALVES